MIEKRYFLSPDGAPVTKQAGESDHADIARRVLGQMGLTPRTYDEAYTLMFRHGFARVVEYPDASLIHAENDNRGFTREQKQYLEDRFLATGFPVKLNKSIFLETRTGGAKTHAQAIIERAL